MALARPLPQPTIPTLQRRQLLAGPCRRPCPPPAVPRRCHWQCRAVEQHEQHGGLVAALQPAQDRLEVTVREAAGEEELWQAAYLRAEAYHERVQYGRFRASFVRQFAGQEARALLRRAADARGMPPRWLTLVALAPGLAAAAEGPLPEVLGSLDVRLLAREQLEAYWRETNQPAAFQPHSAAAPAAYVSNVAVAAQSRGLGVGRQLVAGAQRAAREVLGAQWVYAHVGVDNEAALRLYSGFSFKPLGQVQRESGTSLPERLYLMHAAL